MWLFLRCVAAATLPKVYPGFLWGVADAPVTISVFADPLCPVCLDIWSILKTLRGKYGDRLGVRVHLVNLPYHTWSFYTVRAVYSMSLFGEDKARSMIDALLSGDQALFGSAALKSVPEAAIPATFGKYAASKFAVDEKEFIDGFKDPAAASLSSHTFGFAADRGVDGTPTVHLNGVATELGTDTPISTWTKVIDELLT